MVKHHLFIHLLTVEINLLMSKIFLVLWRDFASLLSFMNLNTDTLQHCVTANACLWNSGRPIIMVTLPGFPKIRQHTKHSGVMLIWLSAILPSTAGSVVQVVRTTDASTNSTGTTMIHHQPWPVEKIHHAWSYGSDDTVLNDYDESLW